jgi:hypothetical protein
MLDTYPPPEEGLGSVPTNRARAVVRRIRQGRMAAEASAGVNSYEELPIAADPPMRQRPPEVVAASAVAPAREPGGHIARRGEPRTAAALDARTVAEDTTTGGAAGHG